ncbi:MAG: GntR family transcriptional regulator [Victivallales bacterium]
MILEQNITHAPSHLLVARLVREIRGGHLKPGEKLDGLRETAQRHQVSLATVRHSFKLLAQDGFIIARHGSGTFVNPALKTKGTKMIALLTTIQKGYFENYFEPLFSEAADSNIIPIIGTIDKDGNWKDSIRKIIAREPDVFLMDIEARHFKLDELRKACASIPCCFVNRWEWHGIKPERAVLNDYSAAYGKALGYLKGRGNDRMLVIGYHNQPQPFLQEYLKRASMSVDMKFGKELRYVGIGDIEGNAGLLKSIFGKNAPTAVFGLADHLVQQFFRQTMKSGIDTSKIDKIGLFNQSHSNIVGQEFTSVFFDLRKTWKKAFDHCNAGDESFVEYVGPEMVIRGSGR